ncbi:hypothetical protein M9Y10_030361 [Tritrichomonas musculus]|uniref:Protein kinase domain-containing protein n=1 Tax=Tritrichomonas musculus TaxID=1915356 RepID=A0ABR2KQ92_9EUKA
MLTNQYWTRRSPRPQVGEIYGSYRIEELIVETKFSMLYSSTCLNTGSKKAMKFIKCIKGKEERIKNEVEIMKRVDHPNLLKLEYSERKDPYMIIVTNYAQSQDLYRFINSNYPSGMPSDVALYTMKQMIDAVSYLHNLGIWHRDIKPQNFLVFNNDNERPHIVLADFGLAKQYKPNETDDSIVGTKQYMAPELINNSRYTKSVDIWALGITFFFMMTNQEAFQTSSSDSYTRENEKIEKLIRSAYLNYDMLNDEKIFPEIPILIKKMCEIFPERRITANELNKYPCFMITMLFEEDENVSSIAKIDLQQGFEDSILSI